MSTHPQTPPTVRLELAVGTEADALDAAARAAHNLKAAHQPAPTSDAPAAPRAVEPRRDAAAELED